MLPSGHGIGRGGVSVSNAIRTGASAIEKMHVLQEHLASTLTISIHGKSIYGTYASWNELFHFQYLCVTHDGMY